MISIMQLIGQHIIFRWVKRFIILLFLLGAVATLSGCFSAGVLKPEGFVAFKERQLLFDSLALMLIVVIPVIVMSFAFVYRYRVAHKTSDYKPNWCHNVFLECIWWGVPCVIIVILGIMTWRMTHHLDPYRKLNVPGKPLFVQAIALPWKWLFIYPQQNIATVNDLTIPVNRQVVFWLASDNVPMSAFFIPQIASQIYTMAGMRTQLHLVANRTGNYVGLNAQYNGAGFSDMHFTVSVVTDTQFRGWLTKVKKSGQSLSSANYLTLLKPRMAVPAAYYSSVTPDLFKNVIDAYRVIGPVAAKRIKTLETMNATQMNKG